MLRNCRSLLTSFLLNLYHKFPVCSICRSCGHLNIYLNPEGPAVCPEGRIKLQQNCWEDTLSREHAHAPSFGSDCSKDFEAELAPSAPWVTAACSVQAWMGLVPGSSKQDGSGSKKQPFLSYNQCEGGNSLSLNPYGHFKRCMSSKLTYHTVINPQLLCL